MNLLLLPKEVIDANVLPYLKWNDLLRFRRVCTATHALAIAYIRVNPQLAPEMEIDEDDKNLGAFLSMNLPTTKIYLNNVSGDEFFEKDTENLNLFMSQFGPLLKSLRLRLYSYFIYGKQWDLLESLVNLEALKAGYYGYPDHLSFRSEQHAVDYLTAKKNLAEKDPRYGQGDIPVPKMFERLRVLKMGQQDKFAFCKILSWTRIFLNTVTKLEQVALPFSPRITPNSTWLSLPIRDPVHSLAIAFAAITSCVEKLTSEKAEEKTSLKSFDFVGYHDMSLEESVIWTGSPVFLELCAECVKTGVMLLNVNPEWYSQVVTRQDYPAELGIPIKSLVGLHPCILFLEMPNLERIQINATSNCPVGESWRHRKTWPALKTLDITVDSQRLEYEVALEQFFGVPARQETKMLFKFFFLEVSRPQLTELRLNFTKDGDSVAVPKTEDIVGACPNIKKVSIVNWPGTNKALTKLWSGLKDLEEVSLENCRGLGNVAFVGEDKRTPVFLKLEKLKKLSLRGLDRMPKITDTLFSLVISHLKLTHFVVTSDQPVQSVTLSGVRALLEGNFAKSIDKFPFQDWSLAGVSPKEFAQLEKEFRSFDML